MTNLNIIGLGNGGCSIATEFASLPEYSSIIRIDSEEQETPHSKCIDIHITKQSKAEDYEDKIPPLKKHFKKLKGEVLFVVAGGGSVSMSSLAILEQLKPREITILYIRPDIEFLGVEGKMKERITFNVFQEYARSGLFKRLYVISNLLVEEAIGGASIISYYEKLNKAIVSTFHMMIMFQNMKPVTSTISELTVGTRISTFGLVDMATEKESMFFNLDTVTDSVYYFAYNEDVLRDDTNLLKRIKNMVRNKIETGVSDVSYGVFATNYKTEFVICANHTSIIT